MGMSIKFLSVSDDKVYEIPKTKVHDGKMVKPELAGKTVLNVQIIYEIKDRRPFKVVSLSFSRNTFDNNGVYDYEREFSSVEGERVMAYVFSAMDSDVSTPLPIPKAPASPTKTEIDAIKEYLERKYPTLLENSPNSIEIAILEEKERYDRNVKMMKRSYKMKEK